MTATGGARRDLGRRQSAPAEMTVISGRDRGKGGGSSSSDGRRQFIERWVAFLRAFATVANECQRFLQGAKHLLVAAPNVLHPTVPQIRIRLVVLDDQTQQKRFCTPLTHSSILLAASP
jgi:hypothetical protein